MTVPHVPPQQPPVSYLPGSWVALVADDVALLAELPADSPVISSAWNALVHGAGLEGVLGTIAQAGHGTVANFALIGPGVGGDTRVVVSGTALVETTADAVTTSHSAVDDPTWRDEQVPGRPAVRLSGGDAASAAPLPVTRAVVLAAAIGLGTSPVAPSSSSAPAAPPEPGSASAPSFQPPEPGSAPAPSFQPPAPVPSAEPGPVPSAEPGPMPARESGTLSLPVPSPGAVPEPGPVPAPEPGGVPEPGPVPAPEPAPEPMPQRASFDTMPPQPDFDSGLIDSLPWRTPDTFGEDQLPPSAAEPVPPPMPPAPTPTPSWGDPYAPPQDPHAHNPWAGAAPPAWPDPAQPAAGDPAPAWPTPGTPPGGNWGEPPASQYAWPDPNPVQDNPWAPGATPARDEPAAPPPQGDGSGGPMVHAFACPRGHLNPPYAGTCRICDEPIPPQEGVAAPRPPLGVLTLSTGDTVPLDRDVVLGRAPFHADENAASRPHLVQLSSPGNDISRSHLRVNLENWFVQVTDLGSTNGTVVTLPDQAPVRLRPHDPFTILPGTTVNIADEVTLRYDAT